MTEQNLNGNSLSLSENDQVRIVEALLFASPDPLDKKTLSEKLPENTKTWALHITAPQGR